MHARQLGLDPSDRLDRLDAVPAAFLHAGRERQGERVDQQVGSLEAVAADGKIVDRLRGAQLPVGGSRLALGVDAGTDDRGPIVACQREEPVEPGAGSVPVLEVHRVQDRSAADPLQGGLDDRRFGGVDDERDGRLGGEAPRHLRHVIDSVGSCVVDADVEQVRPLARLVAGHGDRCLPVAGEHGVAEALRAVGVRALADDEKRELLLERHRDVQRGGRRLMDRRAGSRLELGASRHDLGEVLGCRAAATADYRDPELGDEGRRCSASASGVRS